MRRSARAMWSTPRPLCRGGGAPGGRSSWECSGGLDEVLAVLPVYLVGGRLGGGVAAALQAAHAHHEHGNRGDHDRV